MRVGEQRWCYRDEQDWRGLAERFKQTACPHCQAVGTLNRHGYVRGFDDSSPPRQTVRGRRIFCSNRQGRNRQARPGCGRTFSVWLATKLRRLSLSSGTLWRFLTGVAVVGMLAASRAADCRVSDRTWQRLWTRFEHGQSRIRTALCARCPPPELPTTPTQRPTAHVLAHLQAAFPDAACPIAAFQHTLRTSFV